MKGSGCFKHMELNAACMCVREGEGIRVVNVV